MKKVEGVPSCQKVKLSLDKGENITMVEGRPNSPLSPDIFIIAVMFFGCNE